MRQHRFLVNILGSLLILKYATAKYLLVEIGDGVEEGIGGHVLTDDSRGIWTLTETGMHCLDTIWQGDTDDLVDCQTHCETVGARKLTFIDNPHFGDYCQCCTESSELETGENNEFVYTYQAITSANLLTGCKPRRARCWRNNDCCSRRCRGSCG